tara:strand:+ start:478 stop:657 length:180 start_codon:yes stop_codon:yes gene_type:complete
MNFSNKDNPSESEAKTGDRKKMTHIKILHEPNIQIPFLLLKNYVSYLTTEFNLIQIKNN